MNLVKLVSDQFNDETIGKLSELVGSDSKSAGAAVTAAVPAILSGLASMASRDDGAKKLGDTLGRIDLNSIGNMSQSFGGDADSLLHQGTGMVGKLFGESMNANIANAIGKFSGLDVSSVKKLLAFILPLVLCKVAGQWKSMGGNASALTNMFGDQSRNIAAAVPSGFSLANIPGLATANDAARVATTSAHRAAETTASAGKSVVAWLIPVAALLLVGFVIWSFLNQKSAENTALTQKQPKQENQQNGTTVTTLKPVIPSNVAELPDLSDATKMLDSSKELFSSLKTGFSGIKDAASAESAVPMLNDLKTKLDNLVTSSSKLPEVVLSHLRQSMDTHIKPIREKAEEIAAYPGLSEQLKSLLKEILQKISELTSSGQ